MRSRLGILGARGRAFVAILPASPTPLCLVSPSQHTRPDIPIALSLSANARTVHRLKSTWHTTALRCTMDVMAVQSHIDALAGRGVQLRPQPRSRHQAVRQRRQTVEALFLRRHSHPLRCKRFVRAGFETLTFCLFSLLS